MLTFVIFGASGDLTRRKLIPALFRLHVKEKLDPAIQIVGASRSPLTDDQWRDRLRETTRRFAADVWDDDAWQQLAARIHYQPADVAHPDQIRRLTDRCRALEGERAGGRVYYLATAPQLYLPAIELLGELNEADESHGARRIVVEKPFGTDLASARLLNEGLHRVFAEHQVYRIDHYLGKETVQNLVVLRFANSIFEPIWNRNYIDHVQITVAEDVDVGTRGAYYDRSGVLRDMFQNHLLQLMTITAMEAPVRFEANAVRDEKVKVLRAVRPIDATQIANDSFRAQYAGYRELEGVDPTSETATFAALKLHIDNWRWQGVPFYLRSGKGMSCRTTQIVVQFRQPSPHLVWIDRRFARWQSTSHPDPTCRGDSVTLPYEGP